MKYYKSKINSNNGTSRIVIIIGLVALVLLLAIIIPIINNQVNGGMDDLDSEQVTFAIRQANLEFQTDHRAFTAVFDTENKLFVERNKARSTVTPYGTSKENQGKYLLVSVDDDGKVSTVWIDPYE